MEFSHFHGNFNQPEMFLDNSMFQECSFFEIPERTMTPDLTIQYEEFTNQSPEIVCKKHSISASENNSFLNKKRKCN